MPNNNPNLLVPRAPRSINKDAAHFDKINTLFSSKGHLSLYWSTKAKDIIGARTSVNLKDSYILITPKDLEDVCTPLHDYVVDAISREHVAGNGAIEQTARTIWAHCSQPSVYMGVKNDREVYCMMPISIHHIGAKSLTVACHRYSLTLNDNASPIIIDGYTGVLPTIDQRIGLNELETAFPGSTNLLKTAMAIGMPREEIAGYMFNPVHYVKEAQQLQNKHALPGDLQSA